MEVFQFLDFLSGDSHFWNSSTVTWKPLQETIYLFSSFSLENPDLTPNTHRVRFNSQQKWKGRKKSYFYFRKTHILFSWWWFWSQAAGINKQLTSKLKKRKPTSFKPSSLALGKLRLLVAAAPSSSLTKSSYSLVWICTLKVCTDNHLHPAGWFRPARMRTAIWFSVAFVIFSFPSWNAFSRATGCHQNASWAKWVSFLCLKRVHDSEPREDVISISWGLARIF